MKAISIYALTREQDMNCLQKMERQLSDRSYFLKMREWELSSMKALVEQLERHMENVHLLQIFRSISLSGKLRKTVLGRTILFRKSHKKSAGMPN